MLPDLSRFLSEDFSKPILEEYDGNLHLTHVQLFDEGLGLIHQMNIPPKINWTLIP